MIRLIGFIFMAVVAAPLVAQEEMSPPTTAPTTQPTLIGRWHVVVAPALPPSNGDPPAAVEHVMIFDAERLRVEGPIGDPFGSTAYEFHPPDFRAVFDHEESGNALWAGEISEYNVLRGMILRTRSSGRLEIHHFAGEREGDVEMRNEE